MRFAALAAAALFIGSCTPDEAPAQCCVPACAPATYFVAMPAVQYIQVQPQTVYTSRCRPFLGGWVTRAHTQWVPVQPTPAAEQLPTPADKGEDN